ncbi:MAG TPA: alpha/beta hydrolase [Flavisolibacter sp.]|nr:alpha/beta hydrolase [Flavisolibacter sp.]
MRKLLSFILFTNLVIQVSAQQDLEKKFAELTKNTTGIPYGSNPATGKFYSVRGIKMYAEVYGKGSPLLIIHGNGGSIKDFVNQIPYFSKSYKVIVADSRAQGKSTDKNDSLSYEMMADDYAGLLDAMKIDSAYVIGWSDGGINGLLLAIRHPEKVKKLAITGANLWPDTTAVFDEVEQVIDPAYNYLKTKSEKTAEEAAGWKLMRLLKEQPHIELSELEKISVPTLVMGGDHDVIKPEHTLLIAQHIPNSYLWILPNSGHSTPIVYKEDFNRNIAAFFKTAYRKIEKQGRFF